MAELFISYSQPDATCAFELVARIESEGFSCWIAPRDIAPAADWASEIIDAIAAARMMILVFSANSNASAQVRREVERAVHKQIQIMPFRIEEVVPSKSLEYFLSTQHWLDAFTQPREVHYQRLCSYLKMQFSPLTRVRPLRPAADTPNPSAPSAMSANAGTFQPTELQHIELQLAGYIGPLAKHLVKRAAASSSGMDDLIARLAAGLDRESERREFAHRCRRNPKSH